MLEYGATLASWLQYASSASNGQITVYCILRHISKSGMTRNISLYFHSQDPAFSRAMVSISYQSAHVLGLQYVAQTDSIRVHGTGMDIGFALIKQLKCALAQSGHEFNLIHEWL